ncbi:MAG: hypothetical protein P8X74_04800 [Reinekea sp.]
MKKLTCIFLACCAVLYGCTSNPAMDPIATLDISAMQKIHGSTNTMVAEIVYVQNLVDKSDLYRFEYNNRRDLDIDNYLIYLKPGYYQVVAICTENNFYWRMAGFLNVEKHNDGTDWARFQSANGTPVLIPALDMNLDLLGGETIKPVNMSASSNHYCEAVYGEGKANSTPLNINTTKNYIQRYGKKTKLYSQ